MFRSTLLATTCAAAIAVAPSASLAETRPAAPPPSAPTIQAQASMKASAGATRATAGKKSVRKTVRTAPRGADRARAVTRAQTAGIFELEWLGTSTTCVGQAVTLSVSANATFGLAPATQAWWRSWLLVYNPRTGYKGWLPHQNWVSHRVTAQQQYLGNGVVIDAIGFNPSSGTQQTHLINRGWWVRPVIQVYNHASYGVPVWHADYASGNWCYIA